MAAEDNLKPGNSYYPYSDKDLQKIYKYDANGDIEYVARAQPNSLTSAEAWQIYKYVRVDGVVVSKHFADGTNEYCKEMDEYLTYDYEPNS